MHRVLGTLKKGISAVVRSAWKGPRPVACDHFYLSCGLLAISAVRTARRILGDADSGLLGGVVIRYSRSAMSVTSGKQSSAAAVGVFLVLAHFCRLSTLGDQQTMQKLSMSEITTYRWSFEEDLENLQEANYESVSIWLQKLNDYGEEKGIDLLATSSLEVSSVLWAGGFTGSDGRSFRESIKETIHALRVSAAVEAGCLVLYTGGRNNHTLRHANRLVQTALDELLPIAEVVEVPLAIEPMHPACATEWTFLTDLEQTVELVEQYDTPYLKMVCDTYHFSLHQCSPLLIERLVPHLALIHLADRRVAPSIDQERCRLGTGQLPLEKMVATAIDAGFEGDFDVKLMGCEIEPASYWTILEQSQLAFAKLMSACPQFS